MARIAGRNGILYMNLTSGGVPEPIAFLDKWSMSFSSSKIKVTAFGDTSEVYVAGLPDAQGTYSGFYDNASVQTYTAAVDGIARKFYLYPDRTLATQYWFGTGIFDMSIDSSIDGAVAISGGLAAATVVAKAG